MSEGRAEGRTGENGEIDNQYQCTICQDLLISPVTLLCQHTFCRTCIKAYVKQQTKQKYDDDGYQVYVARSDKNTKCPLCRCAVVIPPNDNFLLKDIIQQRYPVEYARRLDEYEKDTLKLELREKIEDEIRTEIFNSLVDEAVHENNDNDGDITHINNDIVVNRRSPYVNVEGRSWISKLFGSRGNFMIMWATSMIAAVISMIKIGVSIRTYMGICILFWVIYVFGMAKF